MITKHGPHYWLDLRVGGRRIRRSLKTGERALAIEHTRDISRELQEEHARKDIRISDFSAKYLEWAWISKPASADREQQRMKKISAFFEGLGIVHLSDITPYHLEQLRMMLKEQGQAKATINRYLQFLQRMFYKAIDWGFYSGQNPVKKVKFFREDPKVHVMSRAEVDRILEAARAVAKKVHGKGDRTRMVPLNQAAAAIIGRQPKKTEFVFDIPNRTQPDLLRRTVLQVQKQTGIPFHFHLLRHFFATTLLERGVDIVTIASILGHSKLMTSLLYSHTDSAK